MQKGLVSNAKVLFLVLLAGILLMPGLVADDFGYNNQDLIPATTDPYFEISLGHTNNMNFIHKFGRNPDIDQTREALWNGGGDYTGFNPTEAQVLEVFSSDADDTNGGNGAWNVTLLGLDANYNEISETVNLNGLDPVNTTLAFLRMNRGIVRSSGSSQWNEGSITARQNTTTANVMMVMPQTYGQTMIAAYTIPAGKTGYITGWYVALAKKTSGFSNARLVTRPLSGSFNVKEELTLSSDGSSYVLRDYTVPKNNLLEKTDVQITADSSANDFGIAGGFDIILVDN